VVYSGVKAGNCVAGPRLLRKEVNDMGDWNRKAKLFRRWLPQNENAALVLAPLAKRMPNKKLIAVLKNFEARGYSLDKRGAPVGFDEGNAEVIMALHGAFEEVLGKPVVDWFYWALEDEYHEQRKPLLDKFRKWLIDVSESAEELDWWQTIRWKRIKYEVLSKIADYMEDDGYPLNEEGVPTPTKEENADGLWDALETNILSALINHAFEVQHEQGE
jgi:hypothetical protein